MWTSKCVSVPLWTGISGYGKNINWRRLIDNISDSLTTNSRVTSCSLAGAQQLYQGGHVPPSPCYRSPQASKKLRQREMTPHLRPYFRSFHSKQIIPAPPAKADSRIELSVKARWGWGGLPASNISFRHLGSFPSEGCSADREIQTRITLVSASFGEALAQDLSNQDSASAYWVNHLLTCPWSTHTHPVPCRSPPASQRLQHIFVFTCRVY